MNARILVSATVAATIAVCASAPVHGQQERAQPADKTAASKPTPRAADDHPDLAGIWSQGNPPIRTDESKSLTVHRPIAGVNPNREQNVFAALDRVAPAERAADPNMPPYKPELTKKIKDLNDHQSQEDPAFSCKPLGVPRMGPPSEIIQLPGRFVFLYETGNTFRLIPVDRPHRTDIDSSYMGDSVARWEGDTLVVDVNNLNDDTWLGFDGWFHTDAMHVIERLTRNGDVITYQATAEDPNVFTRPWVMNPRTLRIGSRALEEAPPCVEKDAGHLVTNEHH
jgi:hypothetical protein